MITLLWLSCAHRSQHTTPADEAFSPYSTPAGAAALAGAREARSGEANGEAAASAAVSDTRRTRIWSAARGRLPVLHPCRGRNLAGWGDSSARAASVRNAGTPS